VNGDSTKIHEELSNTTPTTEQIQIREDPRTAPIDEQLTIIDVPLIDDDFNNRLQ
jgi:hypothetical protein